MDRRSFLASLPFLAGLAALVKSPVYGWVPLGPALLGNDMSRYWRYDVLPVNPLPQRTWDFNFDPIFRQSGRVTPGSRSGQRAGARKAEPRSRLAP